MWYLEGDGSGNCTVRDEATQRNHGENMRMPARHCLAEKEATDGTFIPNRDTAEACGEQKNLYVCLQLPPSPSRNLRAVMKNQDVKTIERLLKVDTNSVGATPWECGDTRHCRGLSRYRLIRGHQASPEDTVGVILGDDKILSRGGWSAYRSPTSFPTPKIRSSNGSPSRVRTALVRAEGCRKQ